MTSANITHYELYERCDLLITTASQHALCKDSITEVLEKWEVEYPDALLRLRWPDECEVDQYLVFEDPEYHENDFLDHFWVNERDTVKLTSFMRVKRIKEIRADESTIDYLREKLWEYTGDPRVEDWEMRKKFREFQSKVRETAKNLGDDVRPLASVNDGNFSSAFWLKIRSDKQVNIAKEAISYYLSTGNVPTYDEHPQEKLP